MSARDPIIVHKFGGTSVAGRERIAAVARLIDQERAHGRPVIVTSAMAGVTDALVAAARAAGEGVDAAPALADLAARHRDAMHAADPPLWAALDAQLVEVGDLLRATAYLRELTPRTLDRVASAGERLAVRLLTAALRATGLAAEAFDADGFLLTDDVFGEASPLVGTTAASIIEALSPTLEAGDIPVVTGFCGRSRQGATTTLGRGGSDYTATLVGAALGASQVIIWSDVPGVLTADPRVVPDARRVDQLHYREAAELSHYGAKVLHPLTLAPVAASGVPVWVRSSLDPAAGGTLIDGAVTPGSHPVKAISAVRAQALVTVAGRGMAGVPGVAARLFGALAAERISVTMISQASSEASICLAVPGVVAERAAATLRRTFARDRDAGVVDEIDVRAGVGLVAAVGLGMAHVPGVAGRVLGALGARGVNVQAIAQGASELNLTLAVDAAEVDVAIAAIHHAFGLHRRDTGEDNAQTLDLVLLGMGRIGRALVGLLRERSDAIGRRYGLTPRVVGVVDRSGWIFAPRGLDASTLEAVVTGKAAGRALATLPGARAGTPRDLLEHAITWRLSNPVLVDLTDAEGADVLFSRAFTMGCDVVTANKVPLAGPSAAFDALFAEAARHGRLLKAETTVGAGLPVVDTVEVLRAAGDPIQAIEGCLSGTLAFIMTRIEAGDAFSDAVRQAAEQGYTEPDPVVDLTGADVARKALILARWAGLSAADAPTALEGLADPALAGRSLDALVEALRGSDAPMAARVAEAKGRGEVLRYAVRVDAEGVYVGLRAVPAGSPLGQLRGSDNLVSFRSARYAERPLVVSGPGAGTEVTAMGVLGDLMRVAAERRG